MKWVQTETINVRLLVPSALTVAAAVGASVGYVVSMKVLEKKYREIADKEIAEARVYYQGMYSRPVLPAEVVQEEAEPVQREQGEPDATPGTWDELGAVAKDRVITEAVRAMGSYVPPKDDEEIIEKREEIIINTFERYTPPGDEVLDALLVDRDESEPYVITKAEFYDNEPDHEQRRFTYYEGDQVLVDDAEEFNPIQDLNRVVGEDNLFRFGYGSGEEHTVFVRNKSVDPPFDLYITRSTGKYADEVMGFDEDQPHLKHSQPRKFRPYYDD